LNRDADVIEGHAVEIDPVDGRAIDAAMPPARTGLPAPTAPSPAEALAQVATERTADSLPPAALQAGRVDLQARLDKLLAGNPTHDPNRKLLGHLRNERESLLTFLDTPDVQATNWRAEQAIRPAVVNRKHWGGNRTRQGAETQQMLMSVIRTARAQDADPRAPARRLAAARARPMSDPTRRPPRYRLVVHEIRDGRQTTIMDATASGFIAAAAGIQHGEMDVVLGDGGPHDLKAHIALFITNHYRA
jgi:hypothetical protein